MNELKTLRPVYCYYFPETRKLIDDTVSTYPHHVFLQSINPGLDDFEKPIINKLFDFYKSDIRGLKDYTYAYPTSGSSEGICHLLMHIKTNFPSTPIYTLEGEYEGYKEYANDIGLEITEVAYDLDYIKTLKEGFWFISNPSARNGNILPEEFINMLCSKPNKIIYDLTYVGMTRPYLFDVSHPNVYAVLISFSKPFGLYYYRAGFTFCKETIKTLYANKWYKNILTLIIVDKLITEFKYPHYLYDKYKPMQLQVLETIKNDIGIAIRPCDVFLLGYLSTDDFEKLSTPQQDIVKRFARKTYYRFCLTPYFLDIENIQN